MNQAIRSIAVAAIAIAVITAFPLTCSAQFDDQTGQSAEASTFEQPSATQPAGGFADQGGAAQNLSQGTRAGTNNAGLADLFNALDVEQEIPAAVDERRQGFVGATGDLLGRAVDPGVDPHGFVGLTAETVAGSFGGGDIGGDAGRTPRQADLGQGLGGGENGFTVTRRNLRTRVRPSFGFRPVNNQFISTRFQTRLQRLPAMSSYGQNVRVEIKERTAVLTGSVGSFDEWDRIERQLRLEPGVYRIVNQLSIDNAANETLPLQSRR